MILSSTKTLQFIRLKANYDMATLFPREGSLAPPPRVENVKILKHFEIIQNFGNKKVTIAWVRLG